MMRLSMIVAIGFIVIFFFFLRRHSGVFFHFFKRRFYDESDEQISENFLSMNEDFEPFFTGWHNINAVSHLSDATADYGLDGRDLEFLYFDSQILYDFPYYYDYLTDVQAAEEGSYGFEEGGIIGYEDEGDDPIYDPRYIEVDEVSDPSSEGDFDGMSEVDLPEEQLTAKYEVVLPDIDELDNLYDTYKDYLDVVFNEMILHKLSEPEYNSLIGFDNVYIVKDLVSVNNEIYEVEKSFERQKSIRSIVSLPNNYNYNYAFFFKILYLDKDFVLILSDSVLKLVKRHGKLLLFRLMLFDKFVNFLTHYSKSDSLLFFGNLGYAREYGAFDMTMLYSLPRNFFFIFFNLVESLWYPKYIYDLFCISEVEFFKGRDLGVLSRFNIDLLDVCFGFSCGNFFSINWYWSSFFIFLGVVLLFLGFFEFFFDYVRFLVSFRHYIREFQSVGFKFEFLFGLYNRCVDSFFDVEEILLRLGFMIIEHYFLCDEIWFYFYGSHFTFCSEFFNLVDFFFSAVYGTIRFDYV